MSPWFTERPFPFSLFMHVVPLLLPEQSTSGSASAGGGGRRSGGLRWWRSGRGPAHTHWCLQLCLRWPEVGWPREHGRPGAAAAPATADGDGWTTGEARRAAAVLAAGMGSHSWAGRGRWWPYHVWGGHDGWR
jgi:hypothetical protein